MLFSFPLVSTRWFPDTFEERKSKFGLFVLKLTSPSIQVASDSNVQGGEDPVQEPNAEKDLECVDGTLKLKGTYQVHGKKMSGCHTVIAEDAKLELFAPLIFNSTSLEFQGNLAVVAKEPMEGSCLRVLGQVVISGDFFVKDCQNQITDTDEYAYGGGIHVLNMIQKSGRISIENCSSKSNGGAIYVRNSFIQEGGEMMIKHCHAGYRGGGVFALKNFTQNNGALQVEDCSAGWHGGALYAEESFRQTAGSISLSNCRAGIDGGGLLAGDFEQLGGAMRIESCKAKRAGGGLRTAWGKIFRQDGGASRPGVRCSEWRSTLSLFGKSGARRVRDCRGRSWAVRREVSFKFFQQKVFHTHKHT